MVGRALLKTNYHATNNNNLTYILGTVDTVNDNSIVAFAMSLDNAGVPHQYIGRAHSEMDVTLIHEQANAWKNRTLAQLLDNSYPLQLMSSDSPTLRYSQEPDTSVTVLESTSVVSNLPYGEMIGQYTLKKVITGNNWDLFGLQTDIIAIPGYQFSVANNYVNAEVRIDHLWEGEPQKYARIHSDPNTDFTGFHKIQGTYHSTLGTEYNYLYYQSNSTEISEYKYSDTSPKWILNSSDPAGAKYRFEFSPVSIVAVKKITSMPDHNPTMMTIKTSESFVDPEENGKTGGINDSVSFKILNLSDIL